MTKIIQICSNESANYSISDLFALSDDGQIFARENGNQEWKKLDLPLNQSHGK